MNDFNWRNWVSPSRGGYFIAALLIATFLTLPISAQVATEAKYLAFYGGTASDWAIVEVAASAGVPLKWKILKNPSSPVPGAAQISIFDWGITGDGISPGSYNGDNFFDPNVTRPGTAGTPIINWTYYYPAGGAGVQTPWGVSSGSPPDNVGRNGDYDGDGIEDFTTLRISGGQVTWWIRPSSSPGTARVVNFGATATNQSLFAFEGADFTGDGRDELVIARVVNASGLTLWYIGDAVTGAQVNQIIFGNFNTDFIIQPADYTGDGKADIVVFRAGVANPAQVQWWIFNPATNQTLPPRTFGIGDPNFVNMDLPVRGDYDGDGIDDICVWRPSTAVFYTIRSSDGAFVVQQWGVGGDSPDIPLGNFFTF
jgi:hypothetical protein